MRQPTPMDDYLFDMRGYLVLKEAVDADHIAALNAVLDSMPALEFGDWWGNVHRSDNNGAAGIELQNIVEAGEPFECLIDHPSWIAMLSGVLSACRSKQRLIVSHGDEATECEFHLATGKLLSAGVMGIAPSTISYYPAGHYDGCLGCRQSDSAAHN